METALSAVDPNVVNFAVLDSRIGTYAALSIPIKFQGFHVTAELVQAMGPHRTADAIEGAANFAEVVAPVGRGFPWLRDTAFIVDAAPLNPAVRQRDVAGVCTLFATRSTTEFRLVRIGDRVFRSPAGVIYGPTQYDELHRILHALTHNIRNYKKPNGKMKTKHSVWGYGSNLPRPARDTFVIVDNAFEVLKSEFNPSDFLQRQASFGPPSTTVPSFSGPGRKIEDYKVKQTNGKVRESFSINLDRELALAYGTKTLVLIIEDGFEFITSFPKVP